MELRHLRYFVAVAEERHFGRAANRLHMAQPPLSQQIRQLEVDLGVTLLQRTTRRVDLTAAGEAYLDRAREILRSVEEAGLEAQRVGAGLVGRLVIGCVGSATYTLLPALARRLRAELPRVDVSFRGEMLVPDLITGLRRRTLDLALLRPPVLAADVVVRHVRHDRLVVAVPDGHPLAARRRLRIEDLRHEELVAHPSRGRSVMHEVVLALFLEAGVTPRIAHEVAETSTLVTFVAAGLGCAIVPEPVAALRVPGVVYLPLSPASSARVDLVVATRVEDDSAHLGRALQVLREVVSPPEHD